MLKKLFSSNFEVPFAIFVFSEGCVWKILKLILGGNYKLAIRRGFLAPTEHLLVRVMCTAIICSYVRFDIILDLTGFTATLFDRCQGEEQYMCLCKC